MPASGDAVALVTQAYERGPPYGGDSPGIGTTTVEVVNNADDVLNSGGYSEPRNITFYDGDEAPYVGDFTPISGRNPLVTNTLTIRVSNIAPLGPDDFQCVHRGVGDTRSDEASGRGEGLEQCW